VQDFRSYSAVALAQAAGTNFYFSAAVQMAAGNSFAKSAVAAGQSPQVLPGFSLATEELPELGERASLNQLKQAAFTTAPGHLSTFQANGAGGFVLFVQQLLPLDTSKKAAELPVFTTQIRRSRQSEAFNLWLQGEANRELRNTPFFAKMTAGAAKQP
jgi:hypothetical protein